MINDKSIPYWRLSSFYFFYFAFLGLWVPFWNLYLDKILSFDAFQIGYLSATVMLTRIIGPYLWGWLADRSSCRISIIRWGCGLSCISFLLVFLDQSFYWLLICIFLYSFFWNAVLAQFEVITLSHLQEDTQRYSHIRLWGSIGFIFSVFGCGYIFEMSSINYLPYVLLLALAFLWITSFFIHERADNPIEQDPVQKSPRQANSFNVFKTQLLQKPVLVFFCICFLMQLSHGPYYTFYSIYLENLGYKQGVIGALWALGVVAEILVFTYIKVLFRIFGLRYFLIITLALSALRWLLLAFFADNLFIIVFCQLLHAASFGSFHAISMEIVRATFTGRSQGQGQAFYTAVSYGIGGALGAFISGSLWQYGPSVIFSLASLALIVALWLSIKGIDNTTFLNKEGES